MNDLKHKDPTNRTRRAIYVFGSTILFTAIPVSILYLGLDGPIAERATDGFIGLIELIILGYLFTSSVDRSEVLTNAGIAMRERARVLRPGEHTKKQEQKEEEPVG